MVERPEIDGLRGLACLIVLIFHGMAQQFPQWGVYLTGTARIGVWLFFVLSAFLLTLRLLHTGFSWRGMVEYAVARFLRIIPLFVVAVLVYHWLDLIQLGSWSNVAKALTFRDFYNHLWTVPIEFEFYFLLPFIVFCVAYAIRKASVPAGLAVLMTGIIVSVIIWQPNTNPDTIVLGKYLACFGFGIVAAFSVKHLPPPRPRAASIACLLSLLAIVGFVAAMKTGYFEPATDSISGKHPFFGAMFAIITYSVYSARNVWSRALSWWPLSKFGLVIYSTYLFHWILMDRIPPGRGGLPILAAIILSIILGACFYPLEKALHRWREPVTAFMFGRRTA